MNWSEPSPPKENISFYNHCILDTMLGTFIIEWKSHKISPAYDIMLGIMADNKYLDTKYTLEDAKDFVREYIINIQNNLGNILIKSVER